MATAVTLVLSSQSSLSSDIDEGVAYYREKNFSAAFEIFLSSAQQGNAKAQYFLSTMYHSGMGVEPDEDKAFEWCKKAAQEGVLEAQFRLGIMYLQGIGVTEDDDRALEWIWTAADRGYPQAKETLQFILENDFTAGC